MSGIFGDNSLDLHQIDAYIMGKTRIPFRVLVELLLAVPAAEGVFGVPVRAPEPDLFIVDNC